MSWYLILPFEVKQCKNCKAYNLIGADKCSDCGAEMEANNE